MATAKRDLTNLSVQGPRLTTRKDDQLLSLQELAKLLEVSPANCNPPATLRRVIRWTREPQTCRVRETLGLMATRRTGEHAPEPQWGKFESPLSHRWLRKTSRPGKDYDQSQQEEQGTLQPDCNPAPDEMKVDLKSGKVRLGRPQESRSPKGVHLFVLVPVEVDPWDEEIDIFEIADEVEVVLGLLRSLCGRNIASKVLFENLISIYQQRTSAFVIRENADYHSPLDVDGAAMETLQLASSAISALPENEQYKVQLTASPSYACQGSDWLVSSRDPTR